MSKYNGVDNTELVELIERRLREGYWDKALIPELKKRFKALEKKEQLLVLYQAIDEKVEEHNMTDSILRKIQLHSDISELRLKIKTLKELENGE